MVKQLESKSSYSLEYQADKLLEVDGQPAPPPSDDEVEYMDGRLDLESPGEFDLEPPTYDWCAPDGLACGEVAPEPVQLGAPDRRP